MKHFLHKTGCLLFSISLLLSLAACGGSTDVESAPTSSKTASDASSSLSAGSESISSAAESDVPENVPSPSESKPQSEESAAPGDMENNILIAYFTVPMEDGVDTVARASRKQSDDGTLGNVRFMAHVIQKNVGGELFQIETVQKYPVDNMDSLLDFGYSEKADNTRPELDSHIENLEQYDTIFIGYPNWNADLPMPMYSFFEEYDFSGKRLIPFVAHGGSGAARTADTIAQLEPDATVVDSPVTVFWDELDNAESIVTDWVQSLDLTE